ncbi:tRNA pseudouridine synthase A [Gossypium arboreum]|uniref:tRNA pseudouridine synthase n=1 Tax=Gossypium arboreum TaxID=29729 RepID=A0A0B0MHT4_GOSAR|nr:uncharacterized protein LOC108460466 isoform X2 [Gossypium arboreum]KHF99941.1 tRNA pseudouridine synthase A [Gossypium arboreum]KHG13101.1 tRNA pseudouridine synthase A [Gossypium arboreum]
MVTSFTVKSVATFISKEKRLGRFRDLVSLSSMENQTKDKIYFYYNHTDSCNSARWTARESYKFMYERPWQDVLHFFSNVVNARLTLSTVFGTDNSPQTYIDVVDDDYKTLELCDEKEERFGRWERVTFKIILSYSGYAFDGWQKQPGLNTVQEIVEKSLGRFVDDKKARLLKEKSKPLEGCAVVAGRTDKGVSAIRQVCSFYTWRKDVKPCDIEGEINSAAPGKLRVVSVSEVSRVFHPNFSAKWRRYLYIFPLNDQENEKQCCENVKEVESFSFARNCNEPSNKCVESSSSENVENLIIGNNKEFEAPNKPTCFSVCRVNQLLRHLEGKLLSYNMFARDTKASRNIGPPTECFMYHARAAEARIPCSVHEEGRKVMCVELVANRFLRKMVRVLVATSIREAAAGAEEDVLLKLMEATCRRATAPPAPPDGLCLVDVGYTDFNPKNCLIP